MTASEECSLETLSVKNNENISGSDVLDIVDGMAAGGFRCRRLFIVCQSLRGCDLESLTRVVSLFARTVEW